jgi:hypothetical protein
VASFERKVVMTAPAAKTASSRWRPLPPATATASAASKNPAASARPEMSIRPAKNRKRFHSDASVAIAGLAPSTPNTSMAAALRAADTDSLSPRGRVMTAAMATRKIVPAAISR